MKRVLSLGAGVQSTALLLMACLDELPEEFGSLDAAVFADTQWEPAGVYENLRRLQRAAEAAGIAFHTVTVGNIREDALHSKVNARAGGEKRFASMPIYTLSEQGKAGMIRRQCTREYKIEPVEKCIRRTILGLKKGERAGLEPLVEQWFGITTDEMRRVRAPRTAWQKFRYPLIEMKMSRNDCADWLKAYWPHPVTRSACVGCPYRDNESWSDLTQEEFADAVEFDSAIRNMEGVWGQAFLHRSCRPLAGVDLRSEEDRGQLSMFAQDGACEGMCGV